MKLKLAAKLPGNRPGKEQVRQGYGLRMRRLYRKEDLPVMRRQEDRQEDWDGVEPAEGQCRDGVEPAEVQTSAIFLGAFDLGSYSNAAIASLDGGCGQ